MLNKPDLKELNVMLILHVNLKFKAKLRNMSAIVSFLDIELLYYCFYYQQETTRVYSFDVNVQAVIQSCPCQRGYSEKNF